MFFTDLGNRSINNDWFLQKYFPISHLSLRNARITWLDESWNSQGEPPTVTLKQVNLSAFSRENGGIYLTGDGLLPIAKKPVQARWKLEGELFPNESWRIGAIIDEFNLKLLKPYLDKKTAKNRLTNSLSLKLSVNGGASDGGTVQWQLTGKKGVLTMPDLFRWPLPIKALKAQGMLYKRVDTWDLEVNKFRLVNAHGTTQGHFKMLELAEDRLPTIDLTATVSGIPINRVKQYYPAVIMHQPLVRWLDTSLTHGRVNRVNVRIKGPLSEALFTKPKKKNKQKTNPPLFHVEGDITGLSLSYFPGLSPLKNIKTHMVIDGISMSAKISSAQLGKTKKITGKITM